VAVRIEIAGGGLGGLATAVALARLPGAQVHVHEMREALGESGGGIALGENAFRALEVLGVPASFPNAEVVGWEEIRDDGVKIYVGPPRGRYQWVPRTDLHRALLDTALARGASVTTRSRVFEVRRTGEMATTDAGVAVADLVVVADGIGSELRAGLELGTRTRRLNHWGVRAPVSEEIAEARSGWLYEQWSGRRRLGFGRTGEGHSAVWLSWPSADGVLDSAQWERAYPRLAGLLARVFRDELIAHQFGFVWCSRWTNGRAVVLGDAAHAMPPHMGQGGALALQDAAALGAVLRPVDVRRADALTAALRLWARVRRAHAAKVLRYALFYCGVQTMWPPFLGAARPRVLRALYGRTPAAGNEPGHPPSLSSGRPRR
jgi:2-polyprenyl-6-methoxyphenol hydroxylase-like FAD-dependent oxidoreductase